MRLKSLVLFIAYCVCCVCLYAQPDPYLFSHIDVSAGLSNNQVNSIYKDSKGFMWFGTPSGLNRYDGYHFKVFRHSIQDTATLSDNYVDSIFEDFNGKLWVETRAGFNIYDPLKLKVDRNTAAYLKKNALPEAGLASIIRTNNDYWVLYPALGIFRRTADGKIISIVHKTTDTNSIDASQIADIKADSHGNIWVIHINGLLERIDSGTNKIAYRKYLEQNRSKTDFTLCKMYIDAEDDLWFYAYGRFKGIYYYQSSSGIVRLLTNQSESGRLSSNLVFGIVQDEKGLVWISTDHGGINVLDKKNLSVINIVNKNDDSRSLSENSIGPMYKDNLGIIWLGTLRKGIDYYQPNAIRFPHFSHLPSSKTSLPFDDVNSFAEDGSGNLWIGTNGGGLIYFNRKENSFRQYLHTPGNVNSLCNDIIVTMCLDHANKLWIGTYYGGLDCYDGKTFMHYRHSDSDPASLSDDRVMALYEDSNNDLWAGTLSAGLNKFDKATNTFIHFKQKEPNSISNNYIGCITEDAQKNLWVGTAYGITVMERSTGKFNIFLRDNSNLSDNNIVSLLCDSRGNMWAGTREGLGIFNPDKKTFQSFRTGDGLPDNTIRSIQEDRQHNIWISTSSGISKISIKAGDKNNYNFTCKNYDELDGLQGKEYNNNSGLALKSGELIFGGPKGFNLFDPVKIKVNQLAPSIVFTDFQVFNKSINIDDKTGSHIILPQSISETKEITLKYNENVLSIGFASLTYTNTKKNKYAYKLVGFNNEWQYTDANNRTATYTNLDPGTYTFHVKASNEDGVWNEAGIEVTIVVLPPFWKTTFAYLLYAVLILVVLYFARRIVIQRARMRFALEQERRETQRMHELDMMKIRFFTNMSHELRTPISLIMAPVDKLLKEPLTDNKKHYDLIKKNARRLLNLVNQLLDFRKLETNELKLQATEGDFIKFASEIALSFTDLAESKKILFSVESAVDHFQTFFDHDKIERILFNLLSNAFKFTPENGKIAVEINKVIAAGEMPVIEIKIKDTGIGIEKSKQEKIFERFFQSDIPDTVLNQGSGIGLAITKEFVKMHEGTVTVQSELNLGSCFTVRLPFKEIMVPAVESSAVMAEATSASVINEPRETGVSKVLTDAGDGKKPIVLIVEDNDDFRFYLKDNLRCYFTIIEACNGKEAWQKILAHHPDLVVSDISMPVMDGIELCKKIKTDERTKQLPVILLTAYSGEDQQLRGLETGAADYITKPFNFEILLSKVKNLLQYQATVKKMYQKQVQANPTDIDIESPDDEFIKKVLASIEENMDNPDFSVEELSQNLFMSRSNMYKKLFALTGKSPVEFIRHIRLKRAAQLLEKSQLSIAEIAYEVGFNNPKYFSRYFKEEFNVNPSVYQQQKKQNAGL